MIIYVENVMWKILLNIVNRNYFIIIKSIFLNFVFSYLGASLITE